MRFRDLFDLSIGALRLPQRPLPGENGNAVLDVNRVRVRGTDAVDTYLLSDLDFNVAGGVPQLDANGQVPSALLPAAATGGFEIGDFKWIVRADPSNIPSNSLPADGREIIRVLYPTLFSLIGVSCGTPTSDAVFKLPNLLSRSLAGAPGGIAAMSGALRKVSVKTRGSGYTNGNHLLTVSGGVGTAATVRVLISLNTIISVNVVNEGNYTDIGVAANGNNCGLVIPVSGLGGSGATFELYASGSSPQGFFAYTVNRGYGYTSTPEITLGGSLIGATARAIMQNQQVLRVDITNVGNNDLTAPTVTISGGGGTALSILLQRSSRGVMGMFRGQDWTSPSISEMPNHRHFFDVTNGGGASLVGSQNTGIISTIETGTISGAPGGTDEPTTNIGPQFFAIPIIRVL